MTATATSASNSRERLQRALADLWDGLNRWELWGTLGWHDIRQRYRRSIIGPFWLTLSMGVMAASIGFVYAGLFRQPMQSYLPFLVLGFISWNLISGIALDACNAFTAAEGIIKQLRVPLSIHVFRMIWRNAIIFAHNMLVFVVIAVLFGIKPGLAFFLVIPGVVLVLLNGVWMGMLFGPLNARFRDLHQIMGAVIQVLFFVTPIVWKPEQLPDHPAVALLNPAYHLIQVVRAPLLGEAPPLSTWAVVVCVTLLGFGVATAFFQRFRGRVAYWI